MLFFLKELKTAIGIICLIWKGYNKNLGYGGIRTIPYTNYSLNIEVMKIMKYFYSHNFEYEYGPFIFNVYLL